ncbi:MAG: hypothetical protein IGR92_03510 [Leptolyngbyaceae cyanobacterium T60_A2020_046]|nr:hypothetical protein [Leptolyngbyaceae cyanobacterium T60_A2020_046]
MSSREISVVERLPDAPRPGAPATFSLEQITQLHALARAPPEHYGRSISHRSSQELADEVGRSLTKIELKPYQSRYWFHLRLKSLSQHLLLHTHKLYLTSSSSL